MLKTKQMRQIFQPIEKQIVKLSEILSINESTSKTTDEKVNHLKKCILDQLYALLEKFDTISNKNLDNYKKLKMNITLIIEDFCTINFDKNVNSGVYKYDEEIFTALISKFLHLLEELENFETWPLKHQLKECIKYVQEMGAAQEIEDLQNIKELGISIADIIKMLLPYQQNLISPLLSERLLLYCNQLYASFNLLVSVVKEQYEISAPIHMCKRYACERTSLCLESIVNTLDSPQPHDEEESNEIENNFVFRLDMVLDIIKLLSQKSQGEQVDLCDLWLGMEDVFTHAMSIAQICQQDSFKAIVGSCQTILNEYENLKMQLESNPLDQTMINLFINTLTDALYRLEQKINISVLLLVMEVFEDPFKSLKKLIKICGTTLNANDRNKNDLSTAIEEFDQTADKSVQIGKFAIACCRDKKKNAKIRNCLASFESLGTELIPAIITFYLHPTNQEMQSCVKLLTTQWQINMNDFHHSINLIIDPAAYCQIIVDDLQIRINELSGCLDNHRDITQSQVKVIIQRALSLSKQIDATIEDLGQENVDKQTVMTIREFKAAIYESDAALKKFLVRQATAPEQLRVIKRCEIMLKVIKRLLSALAVIVHNSNTTQNITSKELSRKQEPSRHPVSELNFPSDIKNMTFDENSALYMKTPCSVKSCKPPMSIQSENNVTRNESDVSILMPYIQKGQLVRNEWSVMYKTPSRCKPEKKVLYKSVEKGMSSTRQHLFSRNTLLKNNSTDLACSSFDLSSMLEGISQLSSTFS